MENREKLLSDAEGALAVWNYEEALAKLEPYLAKYPSDAAAIALAGIACGQAGRFEDAERHFRATLAINADQPEIARMLVRTLIELRKWEEAMPIAEELAKALPNDRVIKVELASIRENIEVAKIGWERHPPRPSVHIEFGGED